MMASTHAATAALTLPATAMGHTRAAFAALALVAVVALAGGGCASFHGGPLPDAPRDASYAELLDTHVHYQVTPAAEGVAERGVVVLVHGFGATLGEWANVVPALAAAGWRSVALDLRGHGWTSRPEGDYSLAGQARLVLALLDRLGVDRFALVGHSWGSAVSLELAAQVPDRVSRLALYNGMLFADQEPLVFAWARVPGLGELIYDVFFPERADEKLAFAFYDPKPYVTEALVARTEASLARPGTAAAALATIRALDLASLETRYPTITQPVLLMWGREDEVTPLEWGERAANRLPNARLVVLPQCGHIPMLEAAVASTRELIAFLADAARTARVEVSP